MVDHVNVALLTFYNKEKEENITF